MAPSPASVPPYAVWVGVWDCLDCLDLGASCHFLHPQNCVAVSKSVDGHGLCMSSTPSGQRSDVHASETAGASNKRPRVHSPEHTIQLLTPVDDRKRKEQEAMLVSLRTCEQKGWEIEVWLAALSARPL